MCRLLSMRTMEAFYHANSKNLNTVVVRTIAGMGAMGLALALIGLYGLTAFAVSRRTREIGIRMAMGALPASVLRMIMRQGALPSAAGIVLGVLASLAAGGADRERLSQHRRRRPHLPADRSGRLVVVARDLLASDGLRSSTRRAALRQDYASSPPHRAAMPAAVHGKLYSSPCMTPPALAKRDCSHGEGRDTSRSDPRALERDRRSERRRLDPRAGLCLHLLHGGIRRGPFLGRGAGRDGCVSRLLASRRRVDCHGAARRGAQRDEEVPVSVVMNCGLVFLVTSNYGIAIASTSTPTGSTTTAGSVCRGSRCGRRSTPSRFRRRRERRWRHAGVGQRRPGDDGFMILTERTIFRRTRSSSSSSSCFPTFWWSCSATSPRTSSTTSARR